MSFASNSMLRRVHPFVLLTAVTFVCLIPFAGKAFNIDEPLFVWAAERIQAQPLDFYGVEVNWYGVLEPMHRVTKNPPLASYYAAAVGALFGLREVALHLAFMVPAAGVVLGTYRLARGRCSRPRLAALLVLIVLAVRSSFKHTCEACVTFHGRMECRSASGQTPEEALRTAVDNACAFLASGMTETVQCGGTPQCEKALRLI